MEIKCEKCKPIAVERVKSGEMCLGMQEDPDPKCDIFRICFKLNGKIYRDIWLSPVEVVGAKRLLDELFDRIASSTLLAMEEEIE